MAVLALANQKGGCGKTTVAIHLAGALAQAGARVLLVDLDPQAHATLGLGREPGRDRGLFEVLEQSAEVDDVALAAPGGIALLSGGPRLAEIEERAARTLEPERALARALERSRLPWDAVLLDCPPRVDGVLCANAFGACDHAVLVVETGAFALQGALQARRLIEELRAERGLGFAMRVLATLFDRRLRIARELLVALQARFGPEMFATAIRTSVRLREAPALGLPVQLVDPGSRAAADFAALADEVRALAPARARGARLAPPQAAARVASAGGRE